MNNPFDDLAAKIDAIRGDLMKPTDPGPSWLNADEAAEFLKLKKSTLYKKTSRGEIPFHKPGKKLMFRRSELDGFIELSRHNPNIHDGIEIEK